MTKGQSIEEWTEVMKPAKGIFALRNYEQVKELLPLSLKEQGEKIMLPVPGASKKGHGQGVSSMGVEVLLWSLEHSQNGVTPEKTQ